MPVKKSVKKSTVRRNPDVSNDKMVPFGRAVANFFKKYFTFSGVATRAEFWWVFLFLIIVSFILTLVSVGVMLGLQPTDDQVLMVARRVVVGLFSAMYVVVIVPWYALMSRRLHDAGITAKLLWISVAISVCTLFMPHNGTIAVIDWVWLLIMYVLFLFPSKTKNNPYRA